ncbi:hypothetical protein ACCQ08_25440 [Comamonas sp. SY3]|uniref:hypothetical protein n=1 Tax=Comamonas sp. SY3 TaxID=3243601 RepID=UPI0035944C82
MYDAPSPEDQEAVQRYLTEHTLVRADATRKKYLCQGFLAGVAYARGQEIKARKQRVVEAAESYLAGPQTYRRIFTVAADHSITVKELRYALEKARAQAGAA